MYILHSTYIYDIHLRLTFKVIENVRKNIPEENKLLGSHKTERHIRMSDITETNELQLRNNASYLHT